MSAGRSASTTAPAVRSLLVVLVTVPSRRLGQRIAKAAVRERAAACVNLVGSVESCFYWDGRLESAKEYLLICKTTKRAWPRLRRLIRRLHTYTVPEIIAIPVAVGDPPYMDWVKAMTNES